MTVGRREGEKVVSGVSHRLRIIECPVPAENKHLLTRPGPWQVARALLSGTEAVVRHPAPTPVFSNHHLYFLRAKEPHLCALSESVFYIQNHKY